MRLLEFSSMNVTYDEGWQKLGTAIDQATVVSFSVSPAETIFIFETLEKDFLSLFVGNSFCQLETKRRVAEMKLSLLHDSELSFSDKENLYFDVKKLGYSSIDSQTTTEIYYVMCCNLHSEYHCCPVKARIKRLGFPVI